MRSPSFSQVGIRTGRAKIRLGFLTRHYDPFHEPGGLVSKDYLLARSVAGPETVDSGGFPKRPFWAEMKNSYG